jgi:hypothetical protein
MHSYPTDQIIWIRPHTSLARPAPTQARSGRRDPPSPVLHGRTALEAPHCPAQPPARSIWSPTSRPPTRHPPARRHAALQPPGRPAARLTPPGRAPAKQPRSHQAARSQATRAARRQGQGRRRRAASRVRTMRCAMQPRHKPARRPPPAASGEAARCQWPVARPPAATPQAASAQAVHREAARRQDARLQGLGPRGRTTGRQDAKTHAVRPHAARTHDVTPVLTPP